MEAKTQVKYMSRGLKRDKKTLVKWNNPEYTKLLYQAEKHFGGNISECIRYSVLNLKIKKKDLIEVPAN